MFLPLVKNCIFADSLLYLWVDDIMILSSILVTRREHLDKISLRLFPNKPFLLALEFLYS
jgi:hypothetical protein